MKSTVNVNQSAEKPQKTAGTTSEATTSALQDGGSAPDVRALNVDAIATFHSELDQAWELQEFSGDLAAAPTDDAFVFAGTGKDDTGGVGSGDLLFGGGPDTPSGADGTLTGLPPIKFEPIDGTDGDDYIEGTSAGEEIYGGSGHDIILGKNGGDTIFGGDDVDFLYGGRGNDDIYGGRQIDYIDGGRGADNLFGGRGNDELHGREGSDTLLGNEGNDGLFGEAGSDRLTGGNGNDRLYGGDDSDNLFGGVGDDKLYGGDGDDTLTVVGIGAGSDDDIYDGGAGIDTINFAGAHDSIGIALWDTNPQGTGSGLDTFVDIENVTGSRFDDYIAGSGGDNRLEGGDGNDTVDGGPGNDYLSGGDDNDHLSGGTGNDVYNGGDGIDRAVFSGSANGVVVNLSSNSPQNTGEGIDSFFSIENVTGSILGDVIYGSAEDNGISGNDGDDWVWGAAGDDNLSGGAGSDVLVGGAGDDSYQGGLGEADAFVFTANGSNGDDYITDFESGVDKVFVEIGFGIDDFSDLTIETTQHGDAIAYLTGDFHDGNLGSIAFEDIDAVQLTADDFVFF